MSDTFGLMPLQKVCDANAVGGAGTTGAFEIVTDADPWVIQVLSAIFQERLNSHLKLFKHAKNG